MDQTIQKANMFYTIQMPFKLHTIQFWNGLLQFVYQTSWIQWGLENRTRKTDRHPNYEHFDVLI